MIHLRPFYNCTANALNVTLVFTESVVWHQCLHPVLSVRVTVDVCAGWECVHPDGTPGRLRAPPHACVWEMGGNWRTQKIRRALLGEHDHGHSWNAPVSQSCGSSTVYIVMQTQELVLRLTLNISVGKCELSCSDSDYGAVGPCWSERTEKKHLRMYNNPTLEKDELWHLKTTVCWFSSRWEMNLRWALKLDRWSQNKNIWNFSNLSGCLLFIESSRHVELFWKGNV